MALRRAPHTADGVAPGARRGVVPLEGVPVLNVRPFAFMLLML